MNELTTAAIIIAIGFFIAAILFKWNNRERKRDKDRKIKEHFQEPERESPEYFEDIEEESPEGFSEDLKTVGWEGELPIRTSRRSFSLGSIIFGLVSVLVVLIIGTTLFKEVSTQVWNYTQETNITSANSTAAESIMGLIPLFFALGLLMIVITWVANAMQGSGII
jgi:hypothetical protein